MINYIDPFIVSKEIYHEVKQAFLKENIQIVSYDDKHSFVIEGDNPTDFFKAGVVYSQVKREYDLRNSG